MGSPDVLFKGIPNQFVRKYTRDAIVRLRPEVVVIPCAGAFASAIAAVDAGQPPERIVCGDIALYTSAIGYWLAGTDWRLEPKADGSFAWMRPILEPMPLDADDADGRDAALMTKMACVVLAIRILQYDRPAAHYQHRKRELIERAPVYLSQIKATAERAMGRLRGITYHARDLWETLGEHRDNPNALLLVDPPWYKSGYANMFRGVDQAFDWDVPRVPEFDPDDAERLTRWLGEGAATSFVYRGTPLKAFANPADEMGSPWRSVFVHHPQSSSSSVASWIVTNRPGALDTKFDRDDVEAHARPRYRLYDGKKEIHAIDRLEWRHEKRDVVNYYRDLLVHRLALSQTEDYRVLLLNGELIACFGYHVASIRTGGGVSQATLTFAFSPHSERYAKLNKLVLMCAVSSWMWDGVMKDIEQPPSRIATAMLTQYPENKIARGVMTLTEREWQEKTKQYKLLYHADVVHRSASETLALWLRRYAGDSRPQEMGRSGGDSRAQAQDATA
jgi:hypothetical protein